jgi:hypothetical protein
LKHKRTFVNPELGVTFMAPSSGFFLHKSSRILVLSMHMRKGEAEEKRTLLDCRQILIYRVNGEHVSASLIGTQRDQQGLCGIQRGQARNTSLYRGPSDLSTFSFNTLILTDSVYKQPDMTAMNQIQYVRIPFTDLVDLF